MTLVPMRHTRAIAAVAALVCGAAIASVGAIASVRANASIDANASIEMTGGSVSAAPPNPQASAARQSGSNGPTVNGEGVYRASCSSCHGPIEPAPQAASPQAAATQAQSRAPEFATLRQMTPENVLAVMLGGSMMQQARVLTTPERRAVSEFVTGKAFGAEPPPTALRTCASSTPMRDAFNRPHWNGWGVDLVNSRSQPADQAGLTAADLAKLQLKWAFGFAGVTRVTGQPTVVGGRVFIGSETGNVYALDAATGCTLWMFKAESSVRTPIRIGPKVGAAAYVAYFGARGGMVYAVDADRGTLVWQKRVEDHRVVSIPGGPVLYEDRLYVPLASGEEQAGSNQSYECCTFRGSLVALDARTGNIIWKSYMIPEAPKPVGKNKAGTTLWKPAGAGIWSAPTIDVKRRLIYVGTGDGYTSPAAPTTDSIVAIDMANGAIRWVQQMTAGDAFLGGCRAGNENCPEKNGPDFDFGAAPILVTLPGDRDIIVAGQKSGMVHALDPAQNGKVLWQARAGQGSTLGGIQWGMATDGRNVYVPLSDVSAPPPFQPGGLFAYKVDTGELVWHTPVPKASCSPGCSGAQSAAATLIPGVVLSGSLDGHLRAYSTTDGHVVWDQDTMGEYQTVNGVAGRGGSLDGPGPVVVGGMLFVDSGYALFRGRPGNVLLAYGR